MMSADAIQNRRAAFRALHASGCFLLPNPWDVGSAVALARLGAQALATTSSGHAWAHGQPDGAMGRDEILAHLRTMAAATDLPVNADFEDGFGSSPEEVHESVSMAIDTGVAGLSIEDSTGDAEHPLRSIEDSVARLSAARRAIDESGHDVMLVGRAENFFVGRPDLDDTLARIRAYAQAGADCLYAPGIRSAEQIRAVVDAAGGKPVNLLIGSPGQMTLQQAAGLGVRRVSVGGALARSAWAGFLRASEQMLASGSFDALPGTPSGAELNGLFKP
ncbi:isocitrate lyase/phosphoenolpyruvate mutase family protein [Stenotrophomonas lactitubi]|uniref:isocitrate lyase/PEP mutase family protein n=1 Tax=Stenotrophomonas lactitubi TaxID=2045214 RepID=UPI00320B9A8E